MDSGPTRLPLDMLIIGASGGWPKRYGVICGLLLLLVLAMLAIPFCALLLTLDTP